MSNMYCKNCATNIGPIKWHDPRAGYIRGFGSRPTGPRVRAPHFAHVSPAAPHGFRSAEILWTENAPFGNKTLVVKTPQGVKKLTLRRDGRLLAAD